MALLGMAFITLKNLFTPPATRRYPKVKRLPFAGTRGEIKIDITTCIFCGLCSRRCPAQALAVSKPDRSWEIDPLRCVMCRLCVEVCPKKCLSMEHCAHVPVTAHEKHVFVQTVLEQGATESASD